MDPCADHRKRVKRRFLNEGLENFDERYVLEMLLFYCVPRKDTRELAVKMLDHFGSFVRVMEASPQELARVSGVGEGISTFILFLRELHRYYVIKRDASPTFPLLKTEDYGKCLDGRFYYQRNELVYVLCLDAKNKMISCQRITEGSVNSASISIRKIVEYCLNANATSVVVAHNHPGGLAIPSADDVQTTFQIVRAFRSVDINFIDHLVFSDGDYISMMESGYCVGIENCW